jgi:uncharacterized protein
VTVLALPQPVRSALSAGRFVLERAGDVADAKVPCGPCRLCCYGEKVVVLTAYGERPEDYDVVPMAGGKLNGEQAFVLRQHEDGACVYLGPDGCTIYERRPKICRTFDCGGLYASRTRAERRQMSRDPPTKKLLERGRQIHEARAHAQP